MWIKANSKKFIAAVIIDAAIWFAIGWGACNVAHADTYTITDPFDPSSRQRVVVDQQGNGYAVDVFDPTKRHTIRQRGDRTVIYDTFNPSQRTVIRRQR